MVDILVHCLHGYNSLTTKFQLLQFYASVRVDGEEVKEIIKEFEPTFGIDESLLMMYNINKKPSLKPKVDITEGKYFEEFNQYINSIRGNRDVNLIVYYNDALVLLPIECDNKISLVKKIRKSITIYMKEKYNMDRHYPNTDERFKDLKKIYDDMILEEIQTPLTESTISENPLS